MPDAAAGPRTSVLLDPITLWLDVLEHALGRAGIETLARLKKPSEALAVVEKRRPDLFVVDPDAEDERLDGLECIREACARVSTLRVIAVSASDEAARIEAAFEAGALGYVVKTARREDLATAVRQAFDQSVYLGFNHRRPVAAPAANNSHALSSRELRILRLVAEGRSNRQVAKLLWVTEPTVKFHLANIFRKLDVSNRTEASRWAHDQGLLSAGDEAGPADPAH